MIDGNSKIFPKLRLWSSYLDEEDSEIIANQIELFRRRASIGVCHVCSGIESLSYPRPDVVPTERNCGKKVINLTIFQTLFVK